MFVKELPLEMNLVEDKDFVEPNTLVSPHEEVVGEMSRDLKSLYTLASRNDELGMKTVIGQLSSFVQALSDKDPKKASELASSQDPVLEKMKEAHLLLWKAFWFSVTEEFNLWGKGGIGVRKGFLVVTCNKEDS